MTFQEKTIDILTKFIHHRASYIMQKIESKKDHSLDAVAIALSVRI